jgi:uncharacterized protein
MRKYLEASFNCWLLPAIALCVHSATTPGAHGASFDCGSATLPAEKTICGNGNLSGLDDRTAGMYFLIVGSGAPAGTIAQVEQAQRKFVHDRNACSGNIDCLVDAYTSQMMFLKNVKSNLGL